MTDAFQHFWRRVPSLTASNRWWFQKLALQKCTVWVFLLMCFALEVSHLFHTQTPSNWIVNLWWRLIIRPSSEVLMRSYFSWLTSPQITSGDSGFWVWISFRGSFRLAGGIKMSLWCFAGPVSDPGWRNEQQSSWIPNSEKPLSTFSLGISQLFSLSIGQRTKKLFHGHKCII